MALRHIHMVITSFVTKGEGMNSYTENIRNALDNGLVRPNGCVLLKYDDVMTIYKMLKAIDKKNKSKDRYSKKYYQEHKEQIKERQRAYYKAKKEKEKKTM